MADDGTVTSTYKAWFWYLKNPLGSGMRPGENELTVMPFALSLLDASAVKRMLHSFES